jgi:VanZ family protein
MKNFLRYVLPLVVFMGVIFYLSSREAFPIVMPEWVYYFDKFVHAAIFGFLALLFIRNWIRGDIAVFTMQAFVATVVFASLYGITDEFHQRFVPGRTPDVLDWVADTTGAVVMCSLFFWRRAVVLSREDLNTGSDSIKG